MAIKDILVLLDGSPASETRLNIAIGIARGHDAFLVGAYIAPEAVLGRHADEFARGAGVQAVTERETDAEDADAARVAQQFAGLTKTSGIDAEWRPITKYGTAADVVLQARYADLSIVGQSTAHASNALWRPEDLLFGFGGPTLIVPVAGDPIVQIGRNVLVAWDASREAKRAVADAMPFLMEAEVITVLVVDRPPMSQQIGDLGAALARRLIRHGIQADIVEVASNGQPIGEVILEQAGLLEADMVVMGAYGHLRVIEMVFGGATRTILKHMTMPVLMSH